MKKNTIFLFAALISLSQNTQAIAPNPDGTVPTRPMFKDGQAPTPQFSAPVNPSTSSPGQGIYSHQVYSATSKDGLVWIKDGKLLFDHASVPEAGITKDGIIYLYFMDATGMQHVMSVAISKDLGMTWSKQTTVFTGRQENAQPVDPNILLNADGTFRMFYMGSFRSRPPQPGTSAPYSIYSATSTDGIHFTEEKGARFTKNGIITDPDVVKTDHGWKMFVSQGETDLSTSSVDGYTFTEDAHPASTSGAVSKTVSMNGGWRLFHCGRGGIVSQFTKDFVTWQDEGVRVHEEGMICDPSIIRLPDGTWKMFYKTAPMEVR